MKTKIKDSKQFTTALKTIRSTGRELSKAASEVVLYGMEKYVDNGDTSALNRAVAACIGEAKLDTKLMKSYIMWHCNVKLKDPKSRIPVFVKNGKGDATCKDILVAWFDFERESSTGAKTNTDELKMLERFIASMNTKLENKTFESPDHAKRIIDMLEVGKTMVESEFNKPELEAVANS